MKPDIGLNATKLKSVVEILSEVLADAMILYIKTRKYHWNVSGDSFMEYHKLFETQYKKLEASIDEIAERIGKLGSVAIGTAKEFSKHTQLTENPGNNPNSGEMVKELLSDHETVIKSLRKAIDEVDEKHSDAGTADFLTDLIREHETMAWTLRRYGKR